MDSEVLETTGPTPGAQTHDANWRPLASVFSLENISAVRAASLTPHPMLKQPPAGHASEIAAGQQAQLSTGEITPPPRKTVAANSFKSVRRPAMGSSSPSTPSPVIIGDTKRNPQEGQLVVKPSRAELPPSGEASPPKSHTTKQKLQLVIVVVAVCGLIGWFISSQTPEEKILTGKWLNYDTFQGIEFRKNGDLIMYKKGLEKDIFAKGHWAYKHDYLIMTYTNYTLGSNVADKWEFKRDSTIDNLLVLKNVAGGYIRIAKVKE